jgi:hypothetical protein
MWMLLVLVFWVIIALWPASIASSKGRSFFLWFLMSLFFWWITLFVALFMQDKSRPASTPPTE